MITIRQVTIEDAPAVTALSVQLGYPISTAESLENIKALMQSNTHEVFVAVNDQEVIGWMGISYNISLESPPGCEIHGLVVDGNYRNKGIGKMLIEKAKVWSRHTGAGKLRLRCNVKRTEAHRFYLNAGFTEIKQQKIFEIKL